MASADNDDHGGDDINNQGVPDYDARNDGARDDHPAGDDNVAAVADIDHHRHHPAPNVDQLADELIDRIEHPDRYVNDGAGDRATVTNIKRRRRRTTTAGADQPRPR